jgi:hypothetical protein
MVVVAVILGLLLLAVAFWLRRTLRERRATRAPADERSA